MFDCLVCEVLFGRPNDSLVAMSIDFSAKGYLEQFTRRRSPGSYMHLMEGTLKELVEYVHTRNRALIGIYRITVGMNQYTGQEIRSLYDTHLPKR
jgi:hypothetical protein